MLRKLMKYEFKATARILIPLYAALLGFSLINKIFIGFGNDNLSNLENISGISNIISVIVMIGYISTMVAVFVLTFFIIIHRFYKNLLGDEGYLMNTLPVSIDKNIMSKLLASVIWIIISTFVAILSVVIMAFNPGIFKELLKNIGNLFYFISHEVNISNFTIFIEGSLLILLGIIETILMVYASIALGHLVIKRKILASFGAAIGLNMAKNVIITIIGQIAFGVIELSITTANEFFAYANGVLIFSIVLSLIFSITYFIICKYIIKYKLNLE